MRIKEITHKNRRDFTAIYVCENCGHEKTDRGYDDSYFHNEVIPNMKCDICNHISGKVTSSATNPDWMQY